MNNPLPAQGGLSAGVSDGRVPGDDDARIERQIDHESAIALTAFDHYDDLIEHCASDAAFSTALHNIVAAWAELYDRPMSEFENRRLHTQIESNTELLFEGFRDVVRDRVRQKIEAGDSYIYEVKR